MSGAGATGPRGEEPSLSERATASFDITTWDEQPWDEGTASGCRGPGWSNIRIDNLPEGGHLVTLDYDLG